MFDVLSSPFLTVCLAAVVPTMFFCMLNLRFFNWKQVAGAMIAAGTVGIFGGLITQVVSGWAAASAAGAVFTMVGASVHGFFGCLAALLLLLLFAERVLSENLPQRGRRAGVLLAASVALLWASTFFSLLVINAMLLLLAACACVDGFKQSGKTKTMLFSSHNERFLRPAERSEHGIRLERKPNIYVLFLESFHSERAMREIYGIDDSCTTKVFGEHGFTLYDDVFCNEPSTVSSLMNLLNCSLLSSAEGGMFALDVLRDNGYACEFFDNSFYAFGGLPQKGEYTTFNMPGYVYLLYKLAGPFFAQSRFMRKLVMDIDPFNTDIDFPYIYSCLRKRISAERSGPRFFCMRFGATHACKFYPGWDADGSAFAEVYRTAVKKAQPQIEKTVATIKKADPNALIIALGDHGGLRHTYAWHGPLGPDKSLASRGVSMAELAKDHFAVRMAIHWPVAHKTTGVILSHVNIFRYVFEALGGGNALLEELSQNISIIDRQHVLVRDAQVLERFEPFRAEEVFGGLLRRVRNGNAALGDYFQIAEAMQGRDQRITVEVLQEADKKFPNNAHVCGSLGNELGMLGNMDGLDYLEKAVRFSPEHTQFSLNYIKFLCLFGRHADVIKHFNPKVLGSSAEASLYKFRSLLALGRKEEAEDWALRMIGRHPGDYRGSLFFLTFLLEEGRFGEACEIADKAMVNLARIEDVFKNRIRIAKGLALLGARDDKAAETFFAWMAKLPNSGAWSAILWAQVLERNGRVEEGLKALLESAAANVNYASRLVVEAGRMAVRNKIQDKHLLPTKLAALENQRHASNIVSASGIFNEVWYGQKWQDKNDQTPALLHYLHHGVISGINPLPWFNTWSYLLLCPEIWHIGRSPLVYFLECEILQDFSIHRHPWSIVGQRPELIKDRFELLRAANEAWAA